MASTQQVQQLLSSTSDLLQIMSPAGALTYVNPAWCQALGYQPAEVLSTSFFDRVQPADRDRAVAVLLAEQTNNAGELAIGLLAKDGRVVEVVGHSSSIEGETSEIWSLWRLQVQTDALRKSEERLRLIAKGNNDGIWDRNLKTGEVFRSTRWKEILGYSDDELPDDYADWQQHIHPEDLTRVMQVKQQYLARQSSDNAVDYRVRCKDGSYKWVMSRIQAVWDESGAPVRTAGSIRDISERKQIEEALYLREARYTLAVRAGQVGLWDWNLETNHLYMDENFKEMLGFADSEIANDFLSWQQLVYREDFDRVMGAIDDHFAGKLAEYELEYRMLHKDKSLRWFLARGIGIHDREGKPFRLMGTNTDITARKLTEAALRDSEERFRQLAENINSVFFIASTDSTQILYISPAYERIWGRSCTSVYEQPTSWSDAIHLDDCKQVLAKLNRMKQAEPTELEYRIIRPDGSTRWIFTRTFPIFGESGRLLRHVGLAEDISDRKQAEAGILEALAKEKELNELKSRFVSMISHEFRTPLTTIQSAADLLEYYEWAPDRRRERFQQIQEAVQHMTQLLEDVLLIGKAEAGKFQFQPKAIDPTTFCQSLVADFKLTAGSQHAIAFVDRGASCNAWLDPKLLRQTLNNLLSNAIKYSPNGGDIRLELDYQTEQIVFRVQDQGIGIPTAERDHLFEAFYRATNVNTIQGTGLGLAIVKKCVDLHHGQISLQSEVGAGTSFTVTLPLHSAEETSLTK